MATWDITDSGEYIQIDRDSGIIRLLKKKYITMKVEEPYLYLRYHDKENKVYPYELRIDFNDVTAPVSVSATALMATLSGYAGASLGDVSGPGVSVNDNIVLFNGTSGKIIKDSGYKLSDIQPHVFNYLNFH
jgi:hypothetical protein